MPTTSHEELLSAEKSGSWRYVAVLRRFTHVIDGRAEHEYQWSIHELHIHDDESTGTQLSWTEDPVSPSGDDPSELATDIEHMSTDSRTRPWLDLTDEDRPVLRPALSQVDPTTLLASITQTCLACPTQFDALAVDGTALYLRLRHGRGTVRIDNGPGLPLGDVVAEFDMDDPLLGVISLEEFCDRAGLAVTADAQISLMEIEDDPCDTSVLDDLIAQRARQERS